MAIHRVPRDPCALRTTRKTGTSSAPPEDVDLGSLNVILMRKDPPFDTEYIYTTYILERAELAGAFVVNRPASLRDINEKVLPPGFPNVVRRLLSRDQSPTCVTSCTPRTKLS